MSEKHPLIDLNGILHIALVVKDVNEAAAEWSEWTGIPVSKMNMRLKGISKEKKDPGSPEQKITSTVQMKAMASGRRILICQMGCGLN